MSTPTTSARGIRRHWSEGWPDLLILLSLAGLAVVMLALSWRKWTDSLVDSGGQLYLPWRISEGAVFGRDVELPYGPLSVYLNAAVFAILGPGLMHLVVVNLAVYAGILVSFYALLKRGWGRAGAWVGCAVFVTVFSFSHYTLIGNYNYATPYSHEATHGLLACLALVLVLLRWRRQPSTLLAAAAGLLLGAAAVLKLECLLAAVVVVTAFGLLHARERRTIGARPAAAFFAAAMLPTVAFAVFFARHMPWLEAWQTAGQVVFNAAFDNRFTAEVAQFDFLGFDAPWLHFQQHVLATALAALLVGSILAGARRAGREIEMSEGWPWLGWLGGLALTAATAWLSWQCALLEPGPGFALLGLTAICVGLAGWEWEKSRSFGSPDTAAETRLLLGVLGMAMMLRMVLNGRVYHYGFYQAATAAMVVVASLVADWPVRVGGTRPGRRIAMLAALALVAAGAGRLVVLSADNLRHRTLAIGQGPDRMFGFPADIRNAGTIVQMVTEFAEKRIAPNESLLVLPYGVMVNYLTRRIGPPGPVQYFAGPLAKGREAELVERLSNSPPEWVVVINRDLREHGIDRYGESPGKGELLLKWVSARYMVVSEEVSGPLGRLRISVRFFKRAPEVAAPRTREAKGDKVVIPAR